MRSFSTNECMYGKYFYVCTLRQGDSFRALGAVDSQLCTINYLGVGTLRSKIQYLKGTVSRDFDFWFFSWISFPQASEYTFTAISNFFENSRRYSRVKMHHRCQRHRWQMEKIFKQKNFNNLIWVPLGSKVNIFINYCLQVHFKVSAAWYCPHYLPPVSTAQAEVVAKFATGVVDTGGKFAAGVVDTGSNFATGVVDTGGAPWLANISANFRKNSKWP
jgi:hypothetical protein